MIIATAVAVLLEFRELPLSLVTGIAGISINFLSADDDLPRARLAPVLVRLAIGLHLVTAFIAEVGHTECGARARTCRAGDPAAHSYFVCLSHPGCCGRRDPLYACSDGKASNAGGVAVSGLEQTQNALRLSWTREEVDTKLQEIMRSIHNTCVNYGEIGGHVDYVKGANIGGVVKVAETTRSCKLQCNIVSTAYPLGQAHHRHGPARDDVESTWPGPTEGNWSTSVRSVLFPPESSLALRWVTVSDPPGPGRLSGSPAFGAEDRHP
jgi:hypothetical protein